MSIAKQDRVAVEGLHFFDDMTKSQKKASTTMLFGCCSRNADKKINE